MYRFLFLTVAILLSVGCASSSHKAIGVNPGALYKGDLARLAFYLTPGSNNSWGGAFAKELKTDLLDEHFDGSKGNIYKVEVRALTWNQECVEVESRVITAKVSGQLVYSIKTIRPNKKTIYQSEPLSVSKQLTTNADCNRNSGGIRNMGVIYQETKEELLTKLITVFALSMAMSEGKDVTDELKEAIAQLDEEETSGWATFARYFANPTVAAAKGAGEVLGSIGEGLGSVLGSIPADAFDSAYNSGNSNNGIYLTPESYPHGGTNELPAGTPYGYTPVYDKPGPKYEITCYGEEREDFCPEKSPSKTKRSGSAAAM